jgi:hypothetical protein
MEGLRVLIYPFLSFMENPQIRNVKHLKFKVMKALSKLSPKAREWCVFMGYSPEKVKENMKDGSFAVEKLNKTEAKQEGCDLNYPYKLYNPFKFNVK